MVDNWSCPCIWFRFYTGVMKNAGLEITDKMPGLEK